MPIFLVTGANGHGKGQWAIREILRLQDENDKREKEGKPRRPIYTNIHGINEEFLNHLCDGELGEAVGNVMEVFLNHLCDGERCKMILSPTTLGVCSLVSCPSPR